jgi:hypothetical protein
VVLFKGHTTLHSGRVLAQQHHLSAQPSTRRWSSSSQETSRVEGHLQTTRSPHLCLHSRHWVKSLWLQEAAVNRVM